MEDQHTSSGAPAAPPPNGADEISGDTADFDPMLLAVLSSRFGAILREMQALLEVERKRLG